MRSALVPLALPLTATMNVDPASLANAALACTAETDKLIEVVNRSGDPWMAVRIRRIRSSAHGLRAT